MRKIIYICCLLLFTGCKYGDKKTKSSFVSVNDVKNVELSSIIRPNLLEEMKMYLDKQSDRIIIVFFGEKKGYCEITITINNFYFTDLNGHLIVDNKLIAFYFFDQSCTTNWIDTTALIKTKPVKLYPDENSDIISQSNYDPYGKVLKIKDDMTLELIFKGGF